VSLKVRVLLDMFQLLGNEKTEAAELPVLKKPTV
jgi:hypothetical protein